MTEHFSSSIKTKFAFDHEANDQPQAGTQTVITEPPSLYLLIQDPLNVLERIDNVKTKFVNRILKDKFGHKVERIIADHPLCQHCQLMEIFRYWLQGHGMTPVTWNTLIDTLRRGRLHTLADDIYSHISRNALFLLARPDAHWDPEIYNEAAQTLRNRYIDQKVEYAYTGYTSSIPFLDVLLKNMTSGVTIPNSVFIQNLDKYYRLSITGQAGAGKTTLLWHIAKEWANHGVLQSTCDVLFLVQLERLPKSKSYTSLEELFEGLGYQRLNIKRLASEIDMRRGSKACFLIDNFASTYSESNFINNLIYGLLPQSHVIFTSRPYYVTKKSDSIEYVEVLGYKDKDLEKHLNTLCKDEEVRKSMLTLWKEQQTMREMCLLPLHLAMIIDLVKHDTKSPKNSETELYGNKLKIHTRSDIYLSSMNQKLEHFEYFNVEECILEKQSDHDSPCKDLNELFIVAFEMAFSGRNTFDYHSTVQSRHEKTGLATVKKLGTKVKGKTQVLYTFSYPTYCDFFAAIYMTTLPLDKQLAYITMYGKDVAFSNVWLFYFGLLNEYGNETDIPVLLKRYSAHYSHQLPAASFCDFEFETRFLAVVREIYSVGQNPGFITLLKEAGIIINFSLCLEHSNSYEIRDEKFFERLFLQVYKFQFSMYLNINGSTEVISFMLEDHSRSHYLHKEYQQLVTCAQYKEECKGIQGITSIQGNPQSIMDIIGATAYVNQQLSPCKQKIPSNHLYVLLNAGFLNLTTFIILESGNDDIEIAALQYVQQLTFSCNLESAQMSLNCRNFPESYYKLFSQVKNLYLELRNCDKHTLQTNALTNLSGISVISPHDEINLTGLDNLQSLHLIEITIHTANIDQWVEYFNGNMHLKTLEISVSNLSESVVEKLFNNLPRHLENLILEENAFSDHVLDSLSKALTRLSNLRSLSLSNNFIKGSSLQMLAKALSSLKHFHSLDLSYPMSMRICDEGIEALAQVKSLETLNIKGCRIPVRMKNSLVKLIRNLPKLKSFHLQIARVPQPNDVLFDHVNDIMMKSIPGDNNVLTGQHSDYIFTQLIDHFDNPLNQVSRAEINRTLSILYSCVHSPDESNTRNIIISAFGEDVGKAIVGLLNDSHDIVYNNDFIPVSDLKELFIDTLDLLSNMTEIRFTVSESRHIKLSKVCHGNPWPLASATLLNKKLYKALHMLNKVLGALKIRSYQKLIDNLRKFIPALELLLSFEEIEIPNENEIYELIFNYWYEAFEGFDVNKDNFWIFQDVFDLFKEMGSMKNLQNLQVEFA